MNFRAGAADLNDDDDDDSDSDSDSDSDDSDQYWMALILLYKNNYKQIN